MKNSQILMLIGICFLGSLQISSSKAFDERHPMNNVNLAPFIQSLSADYCLRNVSSVCPGKFTLKVDGWLNVTMNETHEFCNGGCAEHTRSVLACVWYVKNDYKFQNKATIRNLIDTINIGCTQGFNGTSLNQSSGSGMVTISAMTTFSALAFLALLFM